KRLSILTLVYNDRVICEEGLAALKNGEFQTAVPLLEKAAGDSGYKSDQINHAYTLALYHIGDHLRLADVAFRIGYSSVHDHPSSAMDYFQRAMFAGLDPKRTRQIGEWFEYWATLLEEAPRLSLSGPVNHVAHVVGSLSPGHGPSQYLKMLVPSLTKQAIHSTIFTTEWASSLFFYS